MSKNTKKETVLGASSSESRNSVSVAWGYDQHECLLDDFEWGQIKSGIPLTKEVPYSYEGQSFLSEWLFNSKARGSLYVTYDDSAVGFDGTMADATIIISGVVTDWSFDVKSGN